MDDANMMALVEQAIAGDAQAFEELCRQKAKSILYLCIKVMGNVHDGEDAAQEVLIVMQKHITRLRSPEAFSSWLYQITVRKCRKMKKQMQSKQVTYLESEADNLQEDRGDFLPQEFADKAESKEVVMEAISELPENCRICVILFYYEALKYKEIATVLGIKTSDVGSLIAKSKKLIRKRLEAKVTVQDTASVAYLISVPGLGALLGQEANVLVSPAMVQNFVASAGALFASGGAAAAGKAAAGKILAGSAGALGVAAAGAFVYLGLQAPPPVPPVSVPVSVVQPVAPPTSNVLSSSIFVINTLQDMLGGEDAAIFLDYVGQQGADGEALQAFLNEIGMTMDVKGTDSASGEVYRFYYLYKQDKLLMAISKTAPDGTAQLAHRFTGEEEPLLKNAQIYFVFDEWKAQA